ncbi:MAG TPA: hypothetical protein VGO29_11555 [Solirubrobacteraceae bacterium]|jgi:hypothetical protein|nr:hypothetical protein [Solirubrobacteraceae bacterium]
MAPEHRFLPRFAAEPPQEDLPYGRWQERLDEEFLAGAARLDVAAEELGEPGEILWYPDRTWHGRTYVPGTSLTANGYELFGYVRFVPAPQDGEPSDFSAFVDFTEETAARNPDWQLDLCDEVIGAWRGESGAIAAMTLVWGHPLVSGGRIATAELANLAVDQCELVSERFTLIAPDDYRHDLLEIKLFGVKGQELARESLYDGEDGLDGPEEDEQYRPAPGAS